MRFREIRTMKRAVRACSALILLFLLASALAFTGFATILGCDLPAVTYAPQPTADGGTTRLTQAQISRAWSLERQCAQHWPTGDDAVDLVEAGRRLRAHGVIVVERRRLKGPLVALPGLLTVPAGFAERDAASQVRTLAHELFHYCRYVMDPLWVDGLTTSSGRWVEEAPAEAQDIRTAVIQGVDPQLDAHLKAFPNTYASHDIDPDQFASETMRLWRSIL
jgi:hypothetical protein